MRLLSAGAVALALSAGGAATATAHSGGDGWDKGDSSGFRPGEGAGEKSAADNCEFSLDGKGWYASVKVDNVNLKPSEDGRVAIHVRTAKEAGSCTASLAAYRTHGPSWETSGEQVFHDFDTVSLGKHGADALDIAVPDEGCYAQIDLYRGGTRFDGGTGEGHGPLPVGPDRPVIKDKLIAAWNGGTRACLEESPAPTPSEPSETGTPSETPPGTTEPTPPSSEEPSATPSESLPPAPSESAPGGESPQAPEASESVAPTTAPENPSGGGNLAETGGGNVGPVAGGAAALLLAGGGVLFAVRRRRAAGH
jgi:LPXTG-motif cell wall-anchored protein